MRIIVCIKPVPDPKYASRVVLDERTKTLNRQGVPSVINLLDKHALEEALRLRERFGGEIIVVSMAPEASLPLLRESLAMGADRLVVLSDRRFAGSDTLATASIIAAAIRSIGHFDLLLCGDETTDSGTAQVSPQIAELLGVPNLMHVSSIQVSDEKTVRVHSEIEDGYMIAELDPPMVLSVVKEINEPRYVTLMDILDGEQKEARVLTADDMILDEPWIGLEGSPTQIVDLVVPEKKTKAEMLQGDARAQAQTLADRLYRMGFCHG
ncbi:MAG: electron transfer flavoprotein subunit beta/FixA family protein [Deltaproteobacteria bacterium]|nr:electron transfer flavoprotein subunit beta/FixA family protein [Deltaproteobacteria bacterium]